ncbi:MAG: S8 family serine peptidase [Candidatus Thorarchaeota archaeon]
MKKALLILLLLSGLVTCLTVFPVNEPLTLIETPVTHEDSISFIGDEEVASVSLRFERELSTNEISHFESLGVDFGDSIQHLDNIYLAEVSKDTALQLLEDPLYQHIEPLRDYNYIPTRDVSAQETYADVAWDMFDYDGENVTGDGILIADLDTGIQWRHPDFFFPDGGSYSWFDVQTSPPWLFINGTDGIDTNENLAIEATEKLYTIDIDNNGTFEVDTDWIWMDNGATIGSIDDGDTFFVVDDQNGDGWLNAGEPLIKLDTPKTKYIVHKPGSTVQVWEQGVNLTSSTFYDTDGHGTGVAGILNGGQIGYRKYVGIAPGAELMAINVFGSDGLTVEEGLIWAQNHGADVIIIELGSWTYQFLDGSSNVELMIDALVASGIPVIVPAGNLRGNVRHATRILTNDVVASERFNVPSGSGATEMYLTVLSTHPFTNVKVNISEPTSTGTIVHQLTLGSGYWNWYNSASTSNLTIDTFWADSPRNLVHMIAIDISAVSGKELKNVSYWSIDVIDSTITPQYHFFISDDISGWGGGAEWHPSDYISDQWTITWPSTADSAISVASYMSRNIWIASAPYSYDAPYSSIGRRVDNAEKMSIAAPGGWDIVSPWSSDSSWQYWYDGTTGSYTIPIAPMFGSYHLFSGTSAAGPHVAGAAALMLQVNPDCGHKVKDIIESTAWTDLITGPLVPPPSPSNIIWGYGKLNVSAAIELTKEIPIMYEVSTNPSLPEYSGSVIVTVNVSIADHVDMLWTNDGGATASLVSMTYSGSGGVYTTTIPNHQYGLLIEYNVTPVNTASIYDPTFCYSYSVDDFTDPLIGSVTSNVTTTVDGSVYSYVQVNATVSEETNSSGIDDVYLWTTTDDWDTYIGYQMILVGGVYVAESPVGFGDMKYHIVAYDNAGNMAVSSDVSYTVTGVDPTGTDTTGTDTSTDTSTDTTAITDILRDNWEIIAIAGAILFVLVICIMLRKRR